MDGPTFEIERFGWGAPDRLEVSGTFSGLATETSAGVVLTVVGEDGPHRLPAIEQADAVAPTDGTPWAAAFSWREAPVAFDRARLELGTSLAVDLPAPGHGNGGDRLEVEVLEGADEPEPPPEAEEPPEPPAVEEPPEPPVATDPAGRLRLETQLLDQAEQLEEARAAAHRAEAALLRAESDLAAEREARAADAERFREGLTLVRSSAEEALAAAADARARDEDRTKAERDEAQAALELAQSELDALRGALAAAQSDAQALVDRLSGRR
jgi:hypothetical protein